MVENRGSSLHFGLGFFDGGEFRISRLCLRGLNEDHCAIRTIPPPGQMPVTQGKFCWTHRACAQGGGGGIVAMTYCYSDGDLRNSAPSLELP
jgi:hypothetical protein